MKGIVMEKSNNYIVIMKPDGTFERIKSKENVEIGKEIIVPDSKSKFHAFYKYASIAATIAVIFTGSYNVYAYYTPYGYMNIDINPSVQLEFNKFDRVINIEGLNEDGKNIINKMDEVKNSKVEDAAQSVVDAAIDYEYIKDEGENDVMISLYAPDSDKKESIKNKVTTTVKSYVEKRNKEVELISESATKEEVELAKLNDISVGKLKLYEKVKAVDPSITLDQVKSSTVKELVSIIKKEKKEDKIEDKIEKKTTKEDDKNASGKKVNLKDPTQTKNTQAPNASETEEPKSTQTPKINNKTILNGKNNLSNNINSKINEIEKKTIPITPNGTQSNSQDSAREKMNNIKDRINEIMKKSN